MNAEKVWSYVGLFIIMLVVSLPINAADALAVSVQISKNQGGAGIEHFIDAQGDVWTVEVLISGAPENGTINPKDVKMKIGDNEAVFNSCSDTTFGAACEYISPLTDGVKENEHAFQVVYNFVDELGDPDSASNADVIRTDGSAPSIRFFPGDVNQNSQGQVEINFNVDDKKEGVPAVGIKEIEIIDADTGNVLQSITNFAEGQEEFNYLNDGGFAGILQGTLEGVGKKSIKIKAEDRLGHKETSKAVRFSADFVKPVIQSNLNLTRFGKFIGEFLGRTDILIDVIESSVPTVVAFSDQADLDGKEASCEADDDIDDLWHCIWKKVEVNPEATVSLLVIATDEKGNKAEKTVSTTLTIDDSPPEIKFFGTIRQFEDVSYLKSGENTIILRVEEQGAGISAEGIRANLGAFGLSSSAKPDECNEVEDLVECIWEIDEKINEGVVTFGLSTFEDNVGNEGEMPESQFIVDNFGPKVEKIEFYGIGGVAGEKNYLQSNDLFRVELTVAESSGLNVLLNLQDLVMDAENTFPEDEFTKDLDDGWQRFTEEDCERDEGKWACVFETDAIKSGPDPNVNFEIKVQDTAGNDAREWDDEPTNIKRGDEGRYFLNLLGLQTETNPDYWEVARVTPLGFVDMDTTPLTHTRIPIKIGLRSSDASVEALSVSILGCEDPSQSAEEEEGKATTPAKSPELSRNLLYGGNFPEGEISPLSTNIILEFTPFDSKAFFKVGSKDIVFKEALAEYTCRLQVFSKVGKNAVLEPEIQEVKIEVPFAFTALGSRDENIDKLIQDIKDDASFQIPDKLKYINDILKLIRYIQPILGILISLNKIINALTSSGDSWRYDFPVYTEPLASALCGAEEGGVNNGIWEVFEYIQVVMEVLSCNPKPLAGTWYGTYQQSVLNALNLYKSAGTRQSVTLYDNIWLSVVGLCLPGILHNLEKLRQIKCVHIDCLQNQVANGATTVAGCKRINDILECKYFWGELIGMLVPLTGLWEGVKNMIKAALTNPIGLVRSALTFGCTLSYCGESGGATTFCDVSAIAVEALDIVDNVIGLVQTFPSISQDFCSRIDEGGIF
jgi:hypothetical protein